MSIRASADKHRKHTRNRAFEFEYARDILLFDRIWRTRRSRGGTIREVSFLFLFLIKMSIKIWDKGLKSLCIWDKKVSAVYVGDKKVRPILTYLDNLFVNWGVTWRDGALRGSGDQFTSNSSSQADKPYRTKHIEATFGWSAKWSDQVNVQLHQWSSGTNAPLELWFRIVDNEVIVSCGYTRGNEIRFNAGNWAGEFRASADVRRNWSTIAGVDFVVKYNGQEFKKSYGSYNWRYLVGLPKGKLSLWFYTPRPNNWKPYVKNIVAY